MGKWVSIWSVCAALGVRLQTQLAKLRSSDYEWACEVMITSTGSDGKKYQMAMIDLESLPMWLVTIKPSKVAFKVREKLRAYKKCSPRGSAGNTAPDGLSKWGASKLIDKLVKRKKEGLASTRQVQVLLASGVDSDIARTMSHTEARAAITELDSIKMTQGKLFV